MVCHVLWMVAWLALSFGQAGGMHTGIIYVGQACRGRRNALWELWDNHLEAVIEPLARRGPVSLFGWFEELTNVSHPYGWLTNGQMACYKEKIIPLANWTELVFQNPRPTRSPKESVADSRKRHAMQHFYKAYQANLTIGRWIIFRPDMWFRTSIDHWGIDDSKDVNVAHADSSHNEPNCFQNEGWTHLMGSDALYVVTPRVMQLAVDQDKSLGRNTLRRQPNGDVLIGFGQAWHANGVPYENLMPAKVLVNSSCEHNTRSSFWDPIYTIGLACCYAWPNESLYANATCGPWSVTTAGPNEWPMGGTGEWAGELVHFDNDPIDGFDGTGAPRRVLNPPHCAERHPESRSANASRPAARPLFLGRTGPPPFRSHRRAR